jgi:prophage regulatory protein
LLRLDIVEDRTGIKRSTIYTGVKAKTFPAPVRIGARAMAWREEDIERFIASRPSMATGGDHAAR